MQQRILSIAIASMAACLLSAPASAQSLSLNPPSSVGPTKWTVSGSCVPGAVQVKLRAQRMGSSATPLTIKTWAQCGPAAGAGKSVTVDLTGQTSGVWNIALRQGGNTSNIVQVTVP